MKPKVYVESSVISYLTARQGRNLIVRSNQAITKEWWKTATKRFDLFISAVVVKEIEAGDKNAARARLAVADALELADIQAEAISMARAIVERGALPKKAEEDALHIAVASYARLDFLVTWNCTHIANAEIRKAIEVVARGFNVNCPIICTPQELMGTKRGVK
jgi:hypothetical protein